MNSKKIESIQALRGIAAMLVVLFHTGQTLHVGNGLFINGSIGVDLFFLISGFIVFYVARNLNDGVYSAKEFFIKRICRIIPPYYIITMLIAGSSIESWLETLRSLLFIPLGGDGPDGAAPTYGYARLYVGWTLNYEFLFYVIATFSILFKSYKWIVLSSIILFLTLAPSVVFGWNDLSAFKGYMFNNVYLRLMTNPLLLEFIFGIFIGYIYFKNIQINIKIFWLLLLFSSLAFFFYVYITGFNGGHGVTKYMIPCAFLLFSVIEYEKRYGISFPNWIIYIGSMSFSIYLIHIKAISLLLKLSRNMEKIGIPLPVNLIAILVIPLTLLLAHYSYKYIEVLLSRYIKDFMLSKIKLRRTIPSHQFNI